MTKRRGVLSAALLLPGILFLAPSTHIAADDAKKAPDALATTRAFLNFAFTGQAKAAAELGEPGYAYDRESKFKEFERLEPKKPPKIISFHADDKEALAITESVKEVRRKGKTREGALSIRLIKKDKRWLVRDVDMGNERAAKNLQRYQREHPKAKDMLPKKDK